MIRTYISILLCASADADGACAVFFGGCVLVNQMLVIENEEKIAITLRLKRTATTTTASATYSYCWCCFTPKPLNPKPYISLEGNP